MGKPPPPPPARPPRPPGSPPVHPPRTSIAATNGTGLIGKVIFGVGLGLFASLGVATAVALAFGLLNNESTPTANPDAEIAGVDVSQTPGQSIFGNQDTVQDHAPPIENDKGSRTQEPEGGRRGPNDSPSTSDPPREPVGQNEADESTNSDTVTPFEDIRQRKRLLELPEIEIGLQSPASVEITRLAAPSSACDLSLLGQQIVFGEDVHLNLDKSDAPDGSRSWTIVLRLPQGLNRTSELGEFVLRDQALSFHWKNHAGRHKESAGLRFCLLKIQVDGQTELCFLGKPLEVEPMKLNLNRSHSRIPLRADHAKVTPGAEHLRVDVKFELPGIRRHTTEPDTGMKPNDTTVVLIYQDEVDQPTVEINVQFQSRNRPSLEFTSFGFADSERTELTFKDDDKLRRDLIRLKREKRRLVAAKAELAQELAAVEKAVIRAAQKREKQVYETKKRQLETRLSILEQRIEKNTAGLTALGWHQDMRSFFEAMKQTGRLHYRVYVDIEGEQVEIVRTKSWNTDI